MKTLEELNRYIAENSPPEMVTRRCTLYVGECEAIHDEVSDEFDALLLSFNLGRAKGYQAGLRAAKRKASA